MSADDYADLARHAEAATGGEWAVDAYGDGWQVNGAGTVFADTHALRADAEFIAAANPATILRLIEDIRRLTSHRDDLLAFAERTANKADALAARLAAVEALADVRNGTVHADHRDPAGVIRVTDLRAALSAAPTDTTKETS